MTNAAVSSNTGDDERGAVTLAAGSTLNTDARERGVVILLADGSASSGCTFSGCVVSGTEELADVAVLSVADTADSL